MKFGYFFTFMITLALILSAFLSLYSLGYQNALTGGIIAVIAIGCNVYLHMSEIDKLKSEIKFVYSELQSYQREIDYKKFFSVDMDDFMFLEDGKEIEVMLMNQPIAPGVKFEDVEPPFKVGDIILVGTNFTDSLEVKINTVRKQQIHQNLINFVYEVSLFEE